MCRHSTVFALCASRAPEPGWLLADNETRLTYPQVECIDTPLFPHCVLANHPETDWLLADNENKHAYPQVECVDVSLFLRCVLVGHHDAGFC